MDQDTIDRVVRVMTFSAAGLAAGLLITVGPIYLRLAVKIRNNYSVMTRTSGRAAVLCGVGGIFLIAVANLFGIAAREAANLPTTWRTWAVMFGFILIDITLILVAAYVRERRKELKENGDLNLDA